MMALRERLINLKKPVVMLSRDRPSVDGQYWQGFRTGFKVARNTPDLQVCLATSDTDNPGPWVTGYLDGYERAGGNRDNVTVV